MSMDLVASYRLLLRLARVSAVDAVDGRERLADLLRAQFKRGMSLRISSDTPVPHDPKEEAEAVLRYLGE